MNNGLLMSHCVFPTPDIILRTAKFYEQNLGFQAVHYLDTVEPHICLYRDATEIILTKSNGQAVLPNRKLYGYGYDAYFITENQTQLQQEFNDLNVKIIRPLIDTDYNNKEFVI
ncbi:VOC family protein [Heyndrickxia oleronia]|uniref:glyoxalase n=1 Tax=Heyndrickxia oleronia TaxID=38875 RepID=UPI001B0BE5EE|nr:glyoxalase [Heyndrickxia oleronia]GIN37289.1 hypothetical protein J19TS1_02380 [Heyndrickxia oleronia]